MIYVQMKVIDYNYDDDDHGVDEDGDQYCFNRSVIQST